MSEPSQTPPNPKGANQANTTSPVATVTDTPDTGGHQVAVQYSTLRLALISVSLMLAIFLFAVSDISLHHTSLLTRKVLTSFFQNFFLAGSTHNSDRDTKDNGPIPFPHSDILACKWFLPNHAGL